SHIGLRRYVENICEGTTQRSAGGVGCTGNLIKRHGMGEIFIYICPCTQENRIVAVPTRAAKKIDRGASQVLDNCTEELSCGVSSIPGSGMDQTEHICQMSKCMRIHLAGVNPGS